MNRRSAMRAAWAVTTLALMFGCEDPGTVSAGLRSTRPGGKTTPKPAPTQTRNPKDLGGNVAAEASPSFPPDLGATPSPTPDALPGPTARPTETPDTLPSVDPTAGPSPTPSATPTPADLPTFTAVRFQDSTFLTLFMPPAQGVETPAGLLSSATLQIVDAQDSATLSAELFDWLSGDAARVEVDATGRVRPKAPGTSLVEIKATARHDPAISASTFVRVKDAAIVDLEIE